MTAIILNDYFGKPIPWKEGDFYYKNGMLSPESMQAYELYNEKIRKENEEADRVVKSLKSKIFEERDKFLLGLNIKKWGGSSPSTASP